MQSLTFALIQTATHWHDPTANRARFDEWFEQVSPAAGVVVLPEMFSTGFTMASNEVAEPMNGPTVAWMGKRAAALGKVICGSLVIRVGERFFNRFIWQAPGAPPIVYDKRHRFRMAGEHRYYAAGEERLLITFNEWSLCPLICYDLRFPVWLRNRNDYDVLLCVANWPAARRNAWRSLVQARAIENQCYAVAVNVLGVDGNHVDYCGDSVAFDAEGQLLVDAKDKPGVFEVTVDRPLLDEFRQRFPAWQDADAFSLDR